MAKSSLSEPTHGNVTQPDRHVEAPGGNDRAAGGLPGFRRGCTGVQRAFTDEGRIADEQLQQRFDANISNFMDLVEASTHYPCVKRAWVEYLGEHLEPSLDRVE